MKENTNVIICRIKNVNDATNITNFIRNRIYAIVQNGELKHLAFYDGTIWGMDFMYHNKIYRITRDTVGNERELRKKFKASICAFIQFYQIPTIQYPDECVNDLNLYIGFYSSVYDLLDNGKIEGLPLRDIIASGDVEILAID